MVNQLVSTGSSCSLFNPSWCLVALELAKTTNISNFLIEDPRGIASRYWALKKCLDSFGQSTGQHSRGSNPSWRLGGLGKADVRSGKVWLEGKVWMTRSCIAQRRPAAKTLPSKVKIIVVDGGDDAWVGSSGFLTCRFAWLRLYRSNSNFGKWTIFDKDENHDNFFCFSNWMKANELLLLISYLHFQWSP